MLQIKVLPYISHIRHAYLAPGGGAGPAFAGGQMCLYQVYHTSHILNFVKIIIFQEEDYVQGRMVRGTFLLL